MYELYVKKKENIRITPCPKCGKCSLKYPQWKSTQWKDTDNLYCRTCGSKFKTEDIING